MQGKNLRAYCRASKIFNAADGKIGRKGPRFALEPVSYLATHGLTADFPPLVVAWPRNTQSIPSASRLDWREIPSSIRPHRDMKQALRAYDKPGGRLRGSIQVRGAALFPRVCFKTSDMPNGEGFFCQAKPI